MKEKSKSLPTISVVIATFNSEKTIDICLTSVRNQNYPQDKIEIILGDGGSTDSTMEKIKKYRVKVVHVPPSLQNAEYNKGMGLQVAKGEIVLMIDHDNVLPHKKWLKKMVQPFLDNREVVGVETLRYHYDPKFSLLDRYFALYGAGEPLVFYSGKTDRLSYIYDDYHLWGKSKDCGDYYLVQFEPKHIPTIGANGFMIRRNILIKNAQTDPDHFYHIDVNVDLIKKGFNTYAYTKDTIIHFTGYKSIGRFLYRKMVFMDVFHVQQHDKRRYSVVFEPEDRYRVMKYILYSLTFVKPTFDSIRGYMKIHDIAWFLNPILSFALMYIYSYVIIKSKLKFYAKKLSQ